MNSTINRILETAFEAAKEKRFFEPNNVQDEFPSGCSEQQLRDLLFEEVVDFTTSDCPRELLDVILTAAALFVEMTGTITADYAVTMRISNALREEIEALISDRQLGYDAVNEFVNDALRSRLDYFRDFQLLRRQKERGSFGT